ncbi:MAG: transcriptional repressor LexA [Armatimonadota bacterium]|nr:transcriptional repressor LexA [Armatimonadota bacterium]MDR7448069.1 transcriptional repressor LexA [Armatimonadota bacterium]MDR7459619.1 transcriptional repressor LexA [Armatimonadota bacterium]MDR7478663.1 transcriptional repressor LexA [Armatimonadota bacterium]MDR7488058.1 transcriptional repressor LexA [Armatimonadota bacterium]
MGGRLTQRQQQILQYVATCIRRSGYVPSVREVGRAVGLRSPSTVHQHLVALERKGYIRRHGDRMRVLQITDRSALRDLEETVALPLVGRVSAGLPVLAEEHVEDMIPVPRRFVGWQEECFLLTVRGDSMVGAGILPGDLVIVRCQQTAQPGDIVVALYGEEATVKRLAREGEQLVLRAEHPAYPVLRGTFEIIGKVVGLLRGYHEARG